MFLDGLLKIVKIGVKSPLLSKNKSVGIVFSWIGDGGVVYLYIAFELLVNFGVKSPIESIYFDLFSMDNLWH